MGSHVTRGRVAATGNGRLNREGGGAAGGTELASWDPRPAGGERGQEPTTEQQVNLRFLLWRCHCHLSVKGLKGDSNDIEKISLEHRLVPLK